MAESIIEQSKGSVPFDCRNTQSKHGRNLKPALIYLASPYTHTNPIIQEGRVSTVSRVAGELIKVGYNVFSPIAHGHTVVQHSNISGSWWQWHNLSLLILSRCDELWICTIDGFGDSLGVNSEVASAKELSMPIKMIDPDTLEVTE